MPRPSRAALCCVLWIWRVSVRGYDCVGRVDDTAVTACCHCLALLIDWRAVTADNHVAAEGCTSLAEAFRHCTALQHLDLGGGRYCRSHRVATVPVVVLCFTRQLTSHALLTSGGQLGNAGATALAGALQSCTLLQHIDLGSEWLVVACVVVALLLVVQCRCSGPWHDLTHTWHGCRYQHWGCRSHSSSCSLQALPLASACGFTR